LRLFAFGVRQASITQVHQKQLRLSSLGVYQSLYDSMGILYHRYRYIQRLPCGYVFQMNYSKDYLTEIQKHYKKLQAAMAARPFLAGAEKRAATAGSD
jgi:hypothetical protein